MAMPSPHGAHEQRIRELEERADGVMQVLEAHGRTLEAISSTLAAHGHALRRIEGKVDKLEGKVDEILEIARKKLT